MGIRHRIRDLIGRIDDGVRVRDVRIGLGYIAVMLEDRRTGVAYTLNRGGHGGCEVFRGARPLAGKTASELIEFLESDATLEIALGLAAANALINSRPTHALPGDVLDAVQLGPSDTVAMIGYFGPLIAPLQSRVARLDIFEEDVGRASNLLGSGEAAERLPKAHAALISSTTIVNDTLDDLLDAAGKCRDVVLLGSTTPLLPAAFEGTPVTYLSGMTVDDPEGILQVVSEGGGTRQFKPFVTKWNVTTGRGKQSAGAA